MWDGTPTSDSRSTSCSVPTEELACKRGSSYRGRGMHMLERGQLSEPRADGVVEQ